jgi:hypothetical protein
MNFIVYLFLWYSVVLALYLMQVAWKRWRPGVRACPHNAGMALKAGQTILGVRETAQGMEFALGVNVRDEKSYDS